jgi:membrane dipeptidase
MENRPLVPIFDGHNDTLLHVLGSYPRPRRDFFKRNESGHIDLPRAREGGFAGGFFAAFTTPDPATGGLDPDFERVVSDTRLPPPVGQYFALNMTMSLAATLFRMEAESGGQFKVVRTAQELRECFANGIVAAIFHIEGAEAIDAQFNSLEVLYQSGLRSLGLVWSRPNIYAEGVPFGFPLSPDTGPGLTARGRELVRECNRRGILIDLSHLNEKGFWDVAEVTNAPLVATHSNAHAVSASARNLTDRQLDAVKDSGGIVGVNFAVSFTRADGGKDADTPLESLATMFDYLCERMGVEHVAFGSDFDGTTIPAELGDVAGLQRLVDALRVKGFSEADLARLGTENWLRVLDATWKQPPPGPMTPPDRPRAGARL